MGTRSQQLKQRSPRGRDDLVATAEPSKQSVDNTIVSGSISAMKQSQCSQKIILGRYIAGSACSQLQASGPRGDRCNPSRIT